MGSITLSLGMSLVFMMCMLSTVWSGLDFKDYEDLATRIKLIFLKWRKAELILSDISAVHEAEVDHFYLHLP